MSHSGINNVFQAVKTLRCVFSFDEIHHGKFAAFYMKNQFFFDSQPPLSKQLFAFAAYMAGFDGKTKAVLINKETIMYF